MANRPEPSEVSAARAALGLSQKKAAALIGVSRVTWARYELGITHMTAAQWQHWKHMAGVDRIPFRSS